MRRSTLTAIATSVLVAVLAPGAGARTPDEPLRKRDFAGSFGIGQGRTMYLECHGAGSPTVILNAGLRNGAAFWSQRSDETPPGPTVMKGIARFTRVCAYDRPGTILTSEPPFEFSRSTQVPMPRTAADAASDIHTLLKVAKVPGPYVLVSHSLGGLIDRHYAADHPRRVAGIVLVDALSEYLQDPLDRDQMAAYGALNNAPIEGIDYDLERIRVVRSFAQVRRAARERPLGDIPLSVISKGQPFGLPDDLPGGLTPEVLESAWHGAQDKLAKLRPDAVHVTAERSSHYVMLTQPKLIVDQTRQVVRAARHRATARTAQLSLEDRQFIDQVVAQVMQEGRIPGAMISITGPRGSYTKTYGVGDLASGAPIALGDHIRIASITKTYTATAVLQQVDRGRLKLSDTIDRWVKGIPNGDEITIRQLLAMRSGLADYTSDPEFTDVVYADPRAPFGPRDVLRILRRSKPQMAPGKRTVYTDANYVLLGIVLEKVTGRSVESLIERRIAKPLKLRKTSFPTRPPMPSPFSHGYYAGDDGQGEIRDFTLINPRLAWTAGGMVSSLGDLRRWGRALATGKLVSGRMHAARLRFGKIPNPGGPKLGYGLGLMHIGKWLGHDGAIFGYSTVTMYLPGSGAQIVVAANLSSNFSTPAVSVFAPIAARLYPRSGL